MYYFWYHDVSPSEVQKHTAEKMDQGEFLTFGEVNFVAPTSVKRQIVAFTVENWDKYLAQHPEARLEDELHISDRQYRSVWIGGVLVQPSGQ
jgi:hypothetical protein